MDFNISKYNVKWTTQSKDSGESMPCGGFDAGANVWVENDEVLMYIDRSGSFDENNQMLKLGRFRFSFSHNPFEKYFSQELILQDGYVLISGEDFHMAVWFDTAKPVCNIEVESGRDIQVTAQYESWRTEERELAYGELGDGERQAAASYICYPGTVITYPDYLYAGTDSVTFYHRNRNEKLLFDFLINQQSLNAIKDEMYNPQKDLTFGGRLFGDTCVFSGNTSGSYAGIGYTGYALKSEACKKHRLYICFNTSQSERIGIWNKELELLCKKAVEDTSARENSKRWWKSFWERSFIDINGDKNESDTGFRLSRNYTLFRYMLGCNAYGSYPTKFNGGLFTTDPCYSVTGGHTFISEKDADHYGKTPDFRMWGGGSFTAQNQRLIYWPMLKSGDFDMMPSQFNYYKRLLKNAELRTKEYWGHKGCSFTEQLENMGLPIGLTYGFDNARWDIFKRPKYYDKTELICAATKYHYSTQLEFAFMILRYYRYTGKDISGYVPFIESVVAFYFEHYEFVHRFNACRPYDENGKLVIFPSTALETYKDALNPTDAVSGLRALISELIHLEEYVDAEYYREKLSRVPDISLGSIDGGQVINPAYSWTHIHNVELPQLYPVFPYEIYGIGLEGQNTAIHTWKTAPDRLKDHISWHQDGIFTARLGLTEDAAEINTKKLDDSGRRFPAFWGPGHDWVPDHNWGGSGMIGLQEMLVQQYGNKVYLFPAWTGEWDVKFKLHLLGGVAIYASMENKKVSWKLVPDMDGIEVIV
ncbi:hypothetical protein DFR58_11951 [Anaerobacterium chartisolvens]|uniref:DUF5703 domain-containing protein n=1 Tax=Anaerobacterium chartisolvens TaxID=1297424 RepID=A0A369AZX3_9FIRM|nr:DUF5703 domain-containing protein [Anaerobacterium chartisolvens]RCX12994.1 hypothetical protein DFR58_11951 [Anaerobacterium chartisolvens]